MREQFEVLRAISYYKKNGQDPPYDGVFQKRYEALFCSKMSSVKGYARAVATGSTACYLALKTLNLESGSEVIMSPVTDSSTLFAIVECGLKPVIANCKLYSYNICVESVSRLISARTSAMYIVHAPGDPADIVQLKELAAKHSLRIIEDISQSPFAAVFSGSQFLGHVGTFGDISACSTMYRKTLQTGSSGGIVYTQSRDLYHKLLEYSDRGKPIWSDGYDQRDPGQASLVSLNYNTNELGCATGIASLKRIDDVIKKRQDFKAKIYNIIGYYPQLILSIFENHSSPFFSQSFLLRVP